jgi:hypothetical protein
MQGPDSLGPALRLFQSSKIENRVLKEQEMKNSSYQMVLQLITEQRQEMREKTEMHIVKR